MPILPNVFERPHPGTRPLGGEEAPAAAPRSLCDIRQQWHHRVAMSSWWLQRPLQRLSRQRPLQRLQLAPAAAPAALAPAAAPAVAPAAAPAALAPAAAWRIWGSLCFWRYAASLMAPLLLAASLSRIAPLHALNSCRTCSSMTSCWKPISQPEGAALLPVFPT